MEPAAVMTRAAFRVATRGRKLPVASAKPATAPDGSAMGRSVTAKTVPDVPIETTTSPGAAPRPSAAPAVSPAPGATRMPDGTPGRGGAGAPAGAGGPGSRGRGT